MHMNHVVSFIKKYKRPLTCLLVGLLAFVVFASVWLTQIRGQGQKSKSWAISDQFHSYATIEHTMVQEFNCDRNLLATGMVLAAADLSNGPVGSLSLVLEDAETGEVLATSTGDMSQIANGWDAYYTVLGLDAPVYSDYTASQHYRLTLTPHYETKGRLCIGYEEKGGRNGTLFSVDGTKIDGTIALLGVEATVGGFLTTFYWVIAFCSTALLMGAYWLFSSKKVGLHWLVFCLVLGFGLLFNIVLPPYSAPDEQFHINQSFTLASGMFNPNLPTGVHPLDSVLHRPSDYDTLAQNERTTVFTWQHLVRQLDTRNTDEWGVTPNSDEMQVEANNTLYWISSFGVLLGFLLRLGFVPTLFLGRLFNLLAFAGAVCWAVKKTPVAKPVFALCALLPISLHLGASYSRDSNLLALAFLFAALVLDAAYCPKETFSYKQLIAPALLGLVLAPSKIVYFPIIFLVFLIPNLRLGRFGRWYKIGFAALCLLFVMKDSVVVQVIDNQLSSPASVATSMAADPAADDSPQPDGQLQDDSASGAQQDASEQQGDAAEPLNAANEPMQASDDAEDISSGFIAPPDDSVCYSIPYMLAHPVDTFELCVHSVVELGDHYLRSLVGGTLSYFTPDLAVNIAMVWVIALCILLCLAWLCPGGIELSTGAKSFAVLLALACCGLSLLGCITWTPIYYTTIYGFQGRYLLPALPLLLLARPKKLSLAVDCSRGLVYAIGIVDAFVLLNVFLTVAAR